MEGPATSAMVRRSDVEPDWNLTISHQQATERSVSNVHYCQLRANSRLCYYPHWCPFKKRMVRPPPYDIRDNFLPGLIEVTQRYFRRPNLSVEQTYARDVFVQQYRTAYYSDNPPSSDECHELFNKLLNKFSWAINRFFFKGLLTKDIRPFSCFVWTRILGKVTLDRPSAQDLLGEKVPPWALEQPDRYRRIHLGQAFTVPSVVPGSSADIKVNARFITRVDANGILVTYTTMIDMVAAIIHEMVHAYLIAWPQLCINFETEWEGLQSLGPTGHGLQFWRMEQSIYDVVREWAPELADVARVSDLHPENFDGFRQRGDRGYV